MTRPFTLFAASPLGIAPITADELRAFGVTELREERAGVAFQGDADHALRALLWLRTASRLVLRLFTCAAGDADALYAGVRGYPWPEVFGVGSTFAVEVTASERSAVRHTQFAGLRVKDAVADRFRADIGERPSVDPAAPDVLIHVHLRGEEAAVGLDLARGRLHERGYRPRGAPAPLRENLAAALLLRAGWVEVAARGGAFLDPMCGSGTLPVEAALIAADIAPGLLRKDGGPVGWTGFDASAWQQLQDEAEARRKTGLARLPPVLGFDRDPRAVALARESVVSAGLQAYIRIEHWALDQLRIAPEIAATRGLLLTNPPYGERLGEESALAGTYAELGKLMIERLDGWQAGVLTGNPKLGQHLGLRAFRSHVFFNGPIECQLLRFRIAPEVQRGPRSHAEVDGVLTAARFFNDSEGAGDVAGFANRLRKNAKHLARWAAREGVTSYRLYDADLPEFALAIDRYQNADTGEVWAHVQEYAPPKSLDPQLARARLRSAMRALPETLGVPPEQVILKVRERQRGKAQYERLAQRGEFVPVTEGGCRLLVNLTDYLDTGLFLDHRPVRTMIQAQAKGKRFLNLFCYTATATVHAARGGAVATTSVDLSSTYLEWAGRNLAENGLSGTRHRLVRADCLQWLEDAAARSARFDLILLDPPTFSNSKRMQGVLDIQRDHATLVRAAMRLLDRGGLLIFSNNFRKFRLDAALLEEFAVEDIGPRTIPPDFARNAAIHHAYLLRHR